MTSKAGETTISTVVDCNGTDVTVGTVCKPGESRDDCWDRHDAAVAEKEAECAEAGGS